MIEFESRVFHLCTYLLWRRIKLDKLNGTLSGGLNCFAACYASVLKDTGVKERYYFIKHHNSVSLAPVSNVCLCLSSAQQQSVYSMPGFVWKKQPDLWMFSFLNLNGIAFYISEAWTLNELLTDWCTTDLDWVCFCKSMGFCHAKGCFRCCPGVHLHFWPTDGTQWETLTCVLSVCWPEEWTLGCFIHQHS